MLKNALSCSPYPRGSHACWLGADKEAAQDVDHDANNYYVHNADQVEHIYNAVKRYQTLQERLWQKSIEDVNDYYAYQATKPEDVKADIAAYKTLQIMLAAAAERDIKNYVEYQRSLPEDVRQDIDRFWKENTV